MRQAAEPLAEDRVDLGGVERVGDPLHAGGRRRSTGCRCPTARTAIARCVSWRFSHSCPFRQSFAAYGKVGAELDEERAEVAVEDVDVVVIGHRGRPDDPGVRLPLRVPPLLGAEDAGLLLRLADEQHALLALERRRGTAARRRPSVAPSRTSPDRSPRVATKRSMASTNRSTHGRDHHRRRARARRAASSRSRRTRRPSAATARRH